MGLLRGLGAVAGIARVGGVVRALGALIAVRLVEVLVEGDVAERAEVETEVRAFDLVHPVLDALQACLGLAHAGGYAADRRDAGVEIERLLIRLGRAREVVAL